MHFRDEDVPAFLKAFSEKEQFILNSPGCTGLSLLRSLNEPAIFFTYSHWVDEGALHAYRESDLFKETWAFVKPLFANRAEAWRMEEIR